MTQHIRVNGHCQVSESSDAHKTRQEKEHEDTSISFADAIVDIGTMVLIVFRETLVAHLGDNEQYHIGQQ